MGILILFVLTVGAGTIIYYLGKGMVKLYRKFHPRDVNAVTGVTELQIALNQIAIKPLPNDRPRNPVYAKSASLEVKALIVKRIEEIEKMSVWERYVMDLKDGLPRGRDVLMKESVFSRFSFYASMAIITIMLIAKPGFLLFAVPLILYGLVWGVSTGTAAARQSFKGWWSKLSPDQVQQVYADVADSNARVEEMRTAFQSSGRIGHLGR